MDFKDKASVKDVVLAGKRVIVRVDFNVISAVTGQVDDENRVKEACPTLAYILAEKPRSVVILSHCGRPKGKKDPKYSLKPVLPILEKHLALCGVKDCKVQWVDDCVGAEVTKSVNSGPDGTVFLCENLRFYAEEEDGTKPAEFRSQLGELGDIVVLDAFGTAHRGHSSISGIPKPIVAGLLLKKELDYFGKVLNCPQRPFLSIIGGAKVKDKIPVIRSMLEKVDDIIIGGGMAYTFLKHKGFAIGNSLYDAEGAKQVADILALAEKNKVNLHFPVDFAIGNKYSNDCNRKIVTAKAGIPDGWEGYDIGPESIKMVKEVIGESKLIVWNGPMGVFEFPNFAQGSEAVLDAVANATKAGAITVIGGGDSGALCAKFKRESEMSHVSTGGGVSLELLEGKILPGVVALADKKDLATKYKLETKK